MRTVFPHYSEKLALGSVAAIWLSVVADRRDSWKRLDGLQGMYIGATAHAQRVPVLTVTVEHFDWLENVWVID